MKSETHFCRRLSEGCGFMVPARQCQALAGGSPVKPQNPSSRQSLCPCPPLLTRRRGRRVRGEQIAFAVFLVSFLLLPCLAHAQTRIEVTPMITVSETYDDNINLTKTNKVSDYITVVTPGVSMNLVREHTNLQLTYAPSFTRYATATT